MPYALVLLKVAALLYAFSVQVALLVFAMRLAFGEERFDRRVSSWREIGADSVIYLRTMLFETLLWPIALVLYLRALARDLAM